MTAPPEPTWATGDVVQDAKGEVYERNIRYIDPTFVWRTFEGGWFRDDQLVRPLVRLVPAQPSAGAAPEVPSAERQEP